MTFLRTRYHYLIPVILATLVASTHAAEPRGKRPVAPSVEQSREPMEEAYAIFMRLLYAQE